MASPDRPKKTPGRPKKIKEEPNTPTPTDNLKQENQKLRKELDELKQLILDLTQNQSQPTEKIATINKIEIDDDNEYSEIKPNKYIKVMSLNFGKLVLSTEGKGRGKVFEFPKFGDVRNIVYTDLANLIHNHQSFAEKGRFYIFDKQVVKNHGLVEYYEKLLTKEMIEKILDYNKDDIVNLFKNATDAQQETIINLLIKKLVAGEELDINKIDIISRLSSVDIYKIANEKIEAKNNTE
jgi:hypothetical protein